MIARSNAVLPLTPAADHEGKEGFFVEVDGSGNAAIVNSAADLPFGVITEGFSNANAAAKDSIAVGAGGFAGTVKVKLNSAPGTVVAGTNLELAADGTVLEDSGIGARVIVAQAVEAGVGDELIEAVIFKPVALS